MSAYVLDPARSSIHIKTFAEGLMARLAHDLDLVATQVQGTAENDQARLEVPLSGLTVGGVLGKDGRIDTRTLSASDCRSILEKMHAEVFRTTRGSVIVEATTESAQVTLPNGRTVTAPLRIARREETRVVGELALSLESIGSAAVKGPMNAFRVKDRVLVAFDVVFVPAS